MYWSGGIFKSILTASEWWTIQQQFHCHVLCWLTLSLSPNINIQILQTELYTFSLQNWSRKFDKRSSKYFPFGGNFINSQNVFSWLCTDKCYKKMYRYIVGRKLMEKMGILGLKGQIAVYIITSRWRNSNCRSISSTTIELNIPIWNRSFQKKRIEKKH